MSYKRNFAAIDWTVKAKMAPRQRGASNAARSDMPMPRVIGDYAAYECPVTGKMIEGRKAHQENLIATIAESWSAARRKITSAMQRRRLKKKIVDATRQLMLLLTKWQANTLVRFQARSDARIPLDGAFNARRNCPGRRHIRRHEFVHGLRI
jgi:hypothetical protein